MQTLGSLKRSFYLVAADVATAAASVRYCTGPIMGGCRVRMLWDKQWMYQSARMLCVVSTANSYCIK